LISDKVQFSGADGSLLAARLDRPHGQLRACALFAHCFTCGKDILAASRISRALTELGIAVLRFDFTGIGMSEGEFANTNFSSNVADLVQAADFLRQHEQAPTLLIGHSLGGAAVLSAARSISEARAVVTLAAPSDPTHIEHQLPEDIREDTDTDRVDVSLAGRSFTITRQFVEDLRAQNQQEQVKNLDRALLVMHSPQDSVVPIEHARRIFQAARHPKSFVSLDGADHLLTSRADAEYVARVIAAWADRYLPHATHDDGEPAAGVARVHTVSGRPFTNEITVGPHRLVADEPEHAGGDDAGPSPYDLLLASLGACTSMTLRMYARRKKWPLDQVEVTLEQRALHARDCEDCVSEDGHVLEITRRIRLSGTLDEDQRTRLMEIADRCPIHRAITGEVKIRTTMEDGP
jgi:uncharacterized OsmC-like protein/alpha-beta hydrolase superfamily lysophospholipase